MALILGHSQARYFDQFIGDSDTTSLYYSGFKVEHFLREPLVNDCLRDASDSEMETEKQSFQTLVHHKHCPPLLFRGAIDSWPARTWMPRHLADILGDKKFQCKLSNIDPSELKWETECPHLMLTLHQYCDWLDDRAADDNPLKHIDQDKYSCYIDYKYMKELFKDNPDVLKDVNWAVFGLEGRNGGDSTIWIGSAGAYTPCHQDTYGFNLVAQISGRKRWYLFDPGQTECMYPTRIPYEESSIYSEVNIRSPDVKRHPLFKKSEAYIVELQPGDVLYVPRHWWHHVECLQSSISVNTWVPMEEDVYSHLHESVSRMLFTTMSSVLLGNKEAEACVNTNEELQPASINLAYLQTSLQALVKYRTQIPKHQHLINAQQNLSVNHDEKIDNEFRNTPENEANPSQSVTNINYFEKFANAFPDNNIKSANMSPIETSTEINTEKTVALNTDTKLEFETGTNIHKESRKRKLNTIAMESINTKHEHLVGRKLPRTSEEGQAVKQCGGMKTKDDVTNDYSDQSSDTSNCGKLEIFATTCIPFKEYLTFLEKEFEYDIDDNDDDANDADADFEEKPTELTSKQKEKNNMLDCAASEVYVRPEVTYDIISVCSKDIVNSEADLSSNQESASEHADAEEMGISIADIINCVLNPGVIEHIGRVLLNKTSKK